MAAPDLSADAARAIQRLEELQWEYRAERERELQDDEARVAELAEAFSQDDTDDDGGSAQAENDADVRAQPLRHVDDDEDFSSINWLDGN